MTIYTEKNLYELRSYLVSNGWQEIITYSLVSQAMVEKKKSNFYQLVFPKNENHCYYRQTLIPSHLQVIGHNFSHRNKNLLFFEISSIYGPSVQEELLILSGTGCLINQPWQQLVIEMDFYWIKGVLENILARWQVESEVSFSPASLDYLSPSSSVEVLLGKEKIGFCGQVNPSLTFNYHINQPLWVAQVSLTKILKYLTISPPSVSYQPVSNYPVSEKDLSFLFPENIDYQQISQEIEKIGGENLQEVQIFDVYQSTEMAKNRQKSVSFHLLFQNSTRALENKEVGVVIKKIADWIEKLFQAKLRE